MKALVLLFLMTLATSAVAAPPVILVDGRVPQYREAVEGIRKFLPDAVEVDPSRGDLAGQLSAAPLVVAVGQKALGIAQSRAQGTPVVYCMVLGVDHKALGSNVTGVPLETDPSALFRHVRTVTPGVKRLGVIYHPQHSEMLMAEAKRASAAAGISLVLKPIESPSAVKDAIRDLSGSIDALWLPPDPRLFTKEVFSFLLSSTAERRLPLFGFLETFTQAGALASVSPDYRDIGAEAGRLAATILARGASGSVPRPVFSAGNLSVNLKTAHALGISVPDAALSNANQVYR